VLTVASYQFRPLFHMYLLRLYRMMSCQQVAYSVVSEDLMVVDKIRHDETLPSETAKSETVRNETVISETATGVTESIETAMNIKENIEIYLNICIHLIRLQAFNVQNCSCYIASLERFVLFVATRSDTSNLQHFTRVASIHTHYTLSFLHTRHSSLG
jgi:hypothetical protein